MNKMLKVAALAMCAFTLVACGSGDGNGNTNTEGATRFHVNNTSSYNIALVKVLDENGNEIFSHSFDCVANNKCDFQATVDVPGTILFLDADATIVGAYILPRKPDNFKAVRTSRTMLGLYIFGELEKRYSIDPSYLYVLLNQFLKNYNSPDGTPDKYQELATYYLYKMIGTGLSQDEFYNEIYNQLESGAVLQPNLYSENNYKLIKSIYANFVNSRLISDANAYTGGTCPSGFILDLKDTAASYIPIPGLGEIFTKLTLIGTEACDGSNATLSDIATRLDEMEAILQKQGRKFDKLVNSIGQTNARNVIADVSKLSDSVQKYENAYKGLVISNGYKSLKEYFDRNGGIQKTYNNSPENNVQLLIGNRHMTNLVADLKAIGNQDNKKIFSEGLASMCNDVASGSDVISARVDCNILIVRYKAIVTHTHGNLLSILKDVTETLDAYKNKEKKFITEVTNNAAGNDSWAIYYKDSIESPLLSNLRNLNQDFASTNDGYYVATKGLPAELLSNLKKIGCDANGEPAVIGWVDDGNDSYISARCKSETQSYRSRYYYKRQFGNANDVVNLLGAVVPRSTWVGSSENIQLTNRITLYVPARSMAISTQNLDNASKPDRGNSVFKYEYIGRGDFYNYSINESDVGGARNPTAVYFRFSPESWKVDLEAYVFGIYFYKNPDTIYRGLGSSMTCANGCRINSDKTISFDNGPQNISITYVKPDSSKPAGDSQHAFTIDNKVWDF